MSGSMPVIRRRLAVDHRPGRSTPNQRRLGAKTPRENEAALSHRECSRRGFRCTSRPFGPRSLADRVGRRWCPRWRWITRVGEPCVAGPRHTAQPHRLEATCPDPRGRVPEGRAASPAGIICQGVSASARSSTGPTTVSKVAVLAAVTPEEVAEPPRTLVVRRAA